MDTQVGSGATIQIEHLRARYVVTRGKRSPEEVRAQLDAALVESASRSLGTALDSLFSPNDPGVVLIRRLDVEVSINAALPRDRIEQVWARQVARRLQAVLSEESDSQSIVRFPDRAAYLAHFMIALVEGSAWSSWLYTSFAGLRVLPLSAALRTALLDRPQIGLAALVRLGDHARPVLRALSAQDAERVLFGLASEEDDAGEILAEAALAAWAARGRAPMDEEVQDALELYVRICRDGSRASPTLARMVLALTRLVRLAVNEHGNTSSLWAALARHDRAGLYLAAGTADAERLAPLLAARTDLFDSLQRILRERRESGRLNTDGSMVQWTEHGGLFYLLPLLDRLPLAEWLDGWAGTKEDEAPELARFLILAKCLGGARARHLLNDPLTRDLLHLSPGLVWADLRDWSRRIRRAQLDLLLKAHAAWQHEQGEELQGGDEQDRRDWRARQAALERDAQHMQFPLEDALARKLDSALAVIAGGVMRALAWRLPGFAHLTMPYLYANFLDLRARMDVEPERRTVRLGRPPLHLILQMNGMASRTYTLGWLDQIPFRLAPDDGEF